MSNYVKIIIVLIIISFCKSILIAQDIDFNRQTEYRGQTFNNVTIIMNKTINDTILFYNCIFKSNLNLQSNKFEKQVVFRKCTFYDKLDLRNSSFHGNTIFENNTFQKNILFNNPTFWNKATFIQMKCDALPEFHSSRFYGSFEYDIDNDFKNVIEFKDVAFYDSIKIGSKSFIQKFNFLNTEFYEKFNVEFKGNHIKPNGSRLILMNPLILKIQSEKLKYIDLFNKLGFYKKKQIVAILKDSNFADEKKYQQERSELDYLFKNSTKYQKPEINHIKKNFFEKSIAYIYDKAMGLGFHPSRIFCPFIIIFIFISSINIHLMHIDINKFINHEFKIVNADNSIDYRKFSLTTILNSLYFTGYIFVVPIKIKGTILTSCKSKTKLILFIEWICIIIFYILFFSNLEGGSIYIALKQFLLG